MNTRGYGPEVKELANDLERQGVGTIDLPPGSVTDVNSEAHRVRSRAYGYARSLGKIFGRPVHVYAHTEDGERFLAFAFE